MDKQTHKVKVIGEVYDRNRFEVHHRVYLTDKKEWSNWYCDARFPTTIEAARTERENCVERQALLSQMIGSQREEYRILKVIAQCEVVE